MTPYRPREISTRLREALRTMPVVILTGMRQAGKTTLLRRDAALHTRRYHSLDDFATLEAAQQSPERLFEGEEPVTIDEAQRVPELLRAIKLDVDHRRRPGQYLLSGSANFHLLKRVTESLAGRAVYLTLHPMHRRELTDGIDSAPFLRELFEKGTPPRRTRGVPLDLAEILRGGMPSVVLGEAEDASVWFRGFEQTYLERDLRDLAQVADLVPFRRLLRLAALRTGQVLNQSELARDAGLPVKTASRYLALLEVSFLVSRLLAHWSSRTTRLIKAPKIFVDDAGLAAHLTGVTSLAPAADEPLAGPLLETYVHQNLAALCEAAWPGAEIGYWHVQGRYEVDFVIRVGRDTLALEVKRGSRWDERDLKGLRAFLAAERRCRGGVLAYMGDTLVPLGERLWAVPIGTVLS
jgi:hypothetical protein